MAVNVDVVLLTQEAEKFNADVQRDDEAYLVTLKSRGNKLIDFRKRVPHGQWEQWVNDNITTSLRTCQRWIRVAENWVLIHAENPAFTLTEAIQYLDALVEENADDAAADQYLETYEQEEAEDTEESNEAESSDEVESGTEVDDVLSDRSIAESRNRLMAELRRIRLIAETEPGALIQTSLAEHSIKDVTKHLMMVKPYRPCPDCEGVKGRIDCKLCNGKGWVNKFVWDGLSDEQRGEGVE